MGNPASLPPSLACGWPSCADFDDDVDDEDLGLSTAGFGIFACGGVEGVASVAEGGGRSAELDGRGGVTKRGSWGGPAKSDGGAGPAFCAAGSTCLLCLDGTSARM